MAPERASLASSIGVEEEHVGLYVAFRSPGQRTVEEDAVLL
jgi:hypothetical protein